MLVPVPAALVSLWAMFELGSRRAAPSETVLCQDGFLLHGALHTVSGVVIKTQRDDRNHWELMCDYLALLPMLGHRQVEWRDCQSLLHCARRPQRSAADAVQHCSNYNIE